jgi:hypothetical protein
MRLSNVFDKYKHMNHLLSDSGRLPDSIQGQIVYDLWQAIKAAQESRAEERKLLEMALRALDGASSVVDAGEGEEYAYQHELEALREALEPA